MARSENGLVMASVRLLYRKLLDEGHFMEDFLIEKTKPEQAE